MAVGRDPQRFANGVRPTVLTDRDGEALARAATPGGDGHLIRSLVQMDAPDHMKYRLLTQGWFMPKNLRSEEHTSELQSLMRISYAVFCLKKKTNNYSNHKTS